jgi:hypothetical protein
VLRSAIVLMALAWLALGTPAAADRDAATDLLGVFERLCLRSTPPAAREEALAMGFRRLGFNEAAPFLGGGTLSGEVFFRPEPSPLVLAFARDGGSAGCRLVARDGDPVEIRAALDLLLAREGLAAGPLEPFARRGAPAGSFAAALRGASGRSRIVVLAPRDSPGDGLRLQLALVEEP